MKKIPLTQGKVALVDDCDYEYLSQWKWYADKRRNTFSATRNTYKDGKRTTIRMHRIITGKMGFQKQNQVDHINRNGLDNRRHNLREVSNKQNSENQGVRKNNTSGYKGVGWHKSTQKWRAYIKHDGQNIHLGLFDNIKDAIKARKEAEQNYFTHA